MDVVECGSLKKFILKAIVEKYESVDTSHLVYALIVAASDIIIAASIANNLPYAEYLVLSANIFAVPEENIMCKSDDYNRMLEQKEELEKENE